MDNEHITLKIIDGIYDIQSPVSPALSSLEIILSLLLFILFISVVTFYVWKMFFSSKGLAKRKIEKLHINYLKNEIKSHDAIFELCSILRQGLKLHYLGKNTHLPAKLHANKQKWADFTKNITTLRYKNNKNYQSDINTLFEDCLFWLKLWP